jgi:SAM-dependent methyltransferase
MTHVDNYAGFVGRFYRFYIERPWLGRIVGRVIWDSDFAPMYRSLAQLRDLPEGAVVLDAPCGAGLVLRWLPPARTARYVGVDNSPTMIERAGRAALRRGFGACELHLADITSIPLPDETADLCLVYNGLQAFPDPGGAVVELCRCLKRGGRLVGSTLVRHARGRADRILERESAKPGGMMGPGGTIADLERWIVEAGLGHVEMTTEGALAVFSAQR